MGKNNFIYENGGIPKYVHQDEDTPSMYIKMYLAQYRDAPLTII